MSEVLTYNVVLFQKEQEGVAIFESKHLEQCKKFTDKERKQFNTFVQNGFPVEMLPEFVIVAYYSDQSTECLEY